MNKEGASYLEEDEAVLEVRVQVVDLGFDA